MSPVTISAFLTLFWLSVGVACLTYGAVWGGNAPAAVVSRITLGGYLSAGLVAWNAFRLRRAIVRARAVKLREARERHRPTEATPPPVKNPEFKFEE